MSYAGSETSEEDSVSDESSSSSEEYEKEPEAESDVPMDDPNDADDEQSSSDADDEQSSSDDNYSNSVYSSPEPDETEGEIVQCEECHCWMREGQSHYCEPEERDKYA
ncbi:hypothetical protein GL218_06065 [Daldinia childiae]|uniref:uncharacterized protein n=1 Tax=Daldinia childiae TaxID=326645 RepID=UPI0014462147|nr:uncharacterized protein GL218_06065 [Daldinia childiae]KAF3057406.1 hypothetical protein GL218_06065 [Daldinia childiae]